MNAPSGFRFFEGEGAKILLPSWPEIHTGKDVILLPILPEATVIKSDEPIVPSIGYEEYHRVPDTPLFMRVK